ncbi:MAG: hypothetical protein EOP58_16345, partial [Sphingomonadales bacterium]
MRRTHYLAGTILGSALAVLAMPSAALAQSSAEPAQVADEPQTDDSTQGSDIIVTGSLFRRTNSETPSPVTVLSAESLQ